MSLEIPATTRPIQEYEDRGADVFGIQRGLNRCGLFSNPIPEDGVFGDKTLNRVTRYQTQRELGADGRFGPKTSRDLSRLIQGQVIAQKVLPQNITFAICDLESNNLIGAVNWSVAGGVDCSIAQRRVYGPPFGDDAIIRAYDVVYQILLMANSLRGRHDSFYGDPGAQSHEKAWRLAALHHNYPYGAAKIAAVGIGGLTSYWTTAQGWVTVHGRKFADGAPVLTPLDWCKHYSLGAPEHNHEGVAVRGVSGWSTA
jgi:hypothetical protein